MGDNETVICTPCAAIGPCFLNLTFQADGSLKPQEPLSKPGDYIDLKAEMDCVIVISNGPQDRKPCNGFNPKPLQIIVFGREYNEKVTNLEAKSTF